MRSGVRVDAVEEVMDVPQSRIQAPPPPPLPPPPREKVDPAVRAPALHKGQKDAPPPEHYVQHEVQRGETLTEVSHRYQTTVPMIQAANPQIKDADQIEINWQTDSVAEVSLPMLSVKS